MSSINSKKIAKNTMFLYMRMLLILGVSLYTSRVILDILGVDDFGIYNLIAGFVTFLTFISNSLVSAMQRFYNVALGEKDTQRYQRVYSMSINILVVFSVVILFFGETIGLWFVANQLNIPSERYDAAIWVFHVSLLTFVANIIRTPFHASIIAHERMSFYAYISIFEVFLRLGVIFLLIYIPGDNLILYSIFYLFVIILIDFTYIYYCKKEFTECKYKLKKDKLVFNELMSFSSWTLLGQASVVVKNQGEAIFINRFFSVAANAAMGIAVQVAGALEMFVSNFQMAFTPQLIQSYASNELREHYKLLFRASKFSYFLLFIMIVPLILNVDYILNLWLVEVPKHTNFFIIFILISYLFNALSTPFMTSIIASGEIKAYNILLSIVFLIGLCVIFITLYLGAPSYSISIVAIFIQICLLAVRLYFAQKNVGVSIKHFIMDVLKPIVLVTCFSLIVCCFLYSKTDNVFELIISIIFNVLIVCILIVLIGLNQNERKFVFNKFKSIL